MKESIKYFLAFLMAQMFCGIFCTVIAQAISFADETQQQTAQLLLATGSASIVTIIIFLWRKWWTVSLDYVKSRPYRAIALTILLSFATLLPSLWLEEQLPKEMRTDLMEDVFRLIMSRPEGFIFIALLAPAVEEIVFRGAILPRLIVWCGKKFGDETGENETVRTRTMWLAIIFSALLFSIVHLNPAQMPHAFLIGILLGWLYCRAHSIVLCVILHFINNSTAFMVNYLMPDIPSDADTIVLFNYDYTLYYAALIASVLLMVLSLVMLRQKR